MENDSDPDELENDVDIMVSDDDDDSFDFSDEENENSIAKRSKLPIVEDDSEKKYITEEDIKQMIHIIESDSYEMPVRIETACKFHYYCLNNRIRIPKRTQKELVKRITDVIMKTPFEYWDSQAPVLRNQLVRLLHVFGASDMITYISGYLEQNIMFLNDSLVFTPELHAALLLLWASASYSEFKKDDKTKVIDLVFSLLKSCIKMLKSVATQPVEVLLSEQYLQVAEVLLILYKILSSMVEFPTIKKENIPYLQEATQFLMELPVPASNDTKLEDNKVKLYSEFDIGHWVSNTFDRKTLEQRLWWRVKNNIVRFLSTWGGADRPRNRVTWVYKTLSSLLMGQEGQKCPLKFFHNLLQIILDMVADAPQKFIAVLEPTWKQLLKSIGEKLSQNAEEIVSQSVSEDMGNTFVDILTVVLNEFHAYGDIYQFTMQKLEEKNASDRAIYEALLLAEGLVMFTSPTQLTGEDMFKLFEAIIPFWESSWMPIRVQVTHIYGLYGQHLTGVAEVPAKYKELCNKFISLLHDENSVVQRQAFVSLYNVFPHIEDKASLAKLVQDNMLGFMRSIGEYHETSVVGTLQAIIEHLGPEAAVFAVPIVEQAVAIVLRTCKMRDITQNESNCLEGLLDLLQVILRVIPSTDPHYPSTLKPLEHLLIEFSNFINYSNWGASFLRILLAVTKHSTRIPVEYWQVLNMLTPDFWDGYKKINYIDSLDAIWTCMNMIHIDFGALLTNGNLATLRRAIQESVMAHDGEEYIIVDLIEVLIVAIHRWKQFHLLSSTPRQLKTLKSLEEIAKNVITNTLDTIAVEYSRKIPRWATCLIYLGLYMKPENLLNIFNVYSQIFNQLFIANIFIEKLSIRERGMMFLGMTSMLKIYSQWPLGLQPYLPKILDCIISLLRSIQAARRGEEVKPAPKTPNQNEIEDFLDDDEDIALAHFYVTPRRRGRWIDSDPNQSIVVTKDFIILNEMDENIIFADAVRYDPDFLEHCKSLLSVQNLETFNQVLQIAAIKKAPKTLTEQAIILMCNSIEKYEDTLPHLPHDLLEKIVEFLRKHKFTVSSKIAKLLNL